MGWTSIDGWALGRPGRLGLVVGGALCVFTGVFLGVMGHDASSAVLDGLLEGSLVGLFFGLLSHRRGAGPNNLMAEQGGQVIAAVRRGEPVRDPALAPSVVQVADLVARSRPLDKRARFVFAGLGLLSAVLAVVDLVTGGPIGVFGLSLAALFLIGMGSWYPRRRHSQIANANKAREYAL
ncbi:MAG: hypothetical protein ACRDZ8_11695 [Acidimicrobiales bacterium]